MHDFNERNITHPAKAAEPRVARCTAIAKAAKNKFFRLAYLEELTQAYVSMGLKMGDAQTVAGKELAITIRCGKASVGQLLRG